MIARFALLLCLSLLLQDAPRLYVVAARAEVMQGDLVTVTVTSFGDVGAVTFDSGGLTVLTDTLGLPTRYVWLRVTGPARDVRVRAWGQGVSSETTIRVCCKSSTRRVFLPQVFRY